LLQIVSFNLQLSEQLPYALAGKYGQNTNISETLPLIGRTVINITLSRTINLMGRGRDNEIQ